MEFSLAIAAVSAAFRGIFPKIAQNVPPQAVLGGAIADHSPQALILPLPELGLLFQGQCFRYLAMFDEEFGGVHIIAGKQQGTVGGSAVPAYPARLLIIALQILGHIVVDDKTDVGFVDAHAKRVGGHHHLDPVIEEILLVFLPLFLIQARVVAGGGDAPIQQKFVDLLHRLPGGAVNDAALARILLHLPQQLRLFILGRHYIEAQILPVKAGDEGFRLFQAQFFQNISPSKKSGIRR